MARISRTIRVSLGTVGSKLGDSRNWFIAATLLPAFLVFIVILAYPLGLSFWMSLHRWQAWGEPTFVGLKNFVKAFADSDFTGALGRTLLITTLSLAVQFVIGFSLALFMQNNEFRGKRLVRVILLTPVMLTPVVVGLIWSVLLNTDWGIINQLVQLVGITPQRWLSKPALAVTMVIAIDTWQATGYSFLILSAGLTALPAEPLEAAKVDGASYFQQIRYIILPLLSPLILLIVIFRGTLLLHMFDKIVTLTGGGPGEATTTIQFLIFNTAFRKWEFGYPAALSWLLILLTFTIVLVGVRLTRRD